MSGPACSSCGRVHGTDPPPFEPRDVVQVIATGAMGWVREWAVYGGPMHVRIQYLDTDHPDADSYGRGNFDPCRLIHAERMLHLSRCLLPDERCDWAYCNAKHEGAVTTVAELITCIACIDRLTRKLDRRKIAELVRQQVTRLPL